MMRGTKAMAQKAAAESNISKRDEWAHIGAIRTVAVGSS